MCVLVSVCMHVWFILNCNFYTRISLDGIHVFLGDVFRVNSA